jgi:MFS family permease
MRQVLQASVRYGLGNPPVRWMMLAAPFTFGVGIYAFYAIQPYLLELYGNEQAYSIAGLAAAIYAGAAIVGGMLAPRVGRLFRRPTTALVASLLIEVVLLTLLGLTTAFWVAVGLLVLWGLASSSTLPIRMAYMNGLIPSEQRATVLSFDNLLGSSGGVVIQPALGKVADAASYATSYLVGAGIALAALPFMLLARRERPVSDPVEFEPAQQGG